MLPAPFMPTVPWQPGSPVIGLRETLSSDVAEIYLDLQVYVTEEYPVLYFDLQVVSTEAAQFVDSANIYLDLRNTGGECYSSSSALNLNAEGNLRWFGDATQRWEAAESTRWFASNNFTQFRCTEDDVSLRWLVIGLSTDQGC